MQNSDKLTSLGHILKEIANQIAKNNNKLLAQNPTDDEEEDVYNDVEIVQSEMKIEYALKDLEEIAKVEGYDENSYVISTLREIYQQIKINELSTASKKIDNIIREVMPFDCEEFFKLFENTQATATRLKGKVCWVLLGPTGAGKSTSIHFLRGSHFKRGNGGSVIIDAVDKSLKDKNIHMGDAVTESKTRYIEAVEEDLSKYKDQIPCLSDRNQPKKILWVDSPGFEDTAGPEVNMANGIGTIRALKKAKKVKVIITFKEAHLDFKFIIIRNIANNMSKAINKLEKELDKSKQSAIAGFLTKSLHHIKSAQQTFKKAYGEQEEKDESSNENAIFKALIHKLGTTGPLYEILIDVENNNNNDKRRLQIIKSLVEDTGYINTPKQIFSEFISESALSKLKAQIDKNYETIQNILDNDKYFENTKYIQYIIDILNTLDNLKKIIKNAGGNYIESKLLDCMNIFKIKWNQKIAKANKILTNINIKECRSSLLKKKLNEFNLIKNIMKGNMRVIQACKYKKEFKDINCLDDGLHECFNDAYEIINNYLKDIRNQLKDTFNDSGDETEQEDNKSTEAIDDDNNDKYNYSDDNARYKIVLGVIQKCFLLYKQNKHDKHIRGRIKAFKRLVDDVTFEKAKKKAYNFIGSNQSQNVNGVSKLMFILSTLSKLQKILFIMDDLNENDLQIIAQRSTTGNFEEDDDDDDDDSNKSLRVTKIIEELNRKLKSNIAKNIRSICNSYSLNVMKVMDEEIEEKAKEYVDVDALLNSKAPLKNDEAIHKRENKLISFCLFLNTLNESLRDSNLVKNTKEMNNSFTNLQNWLDTTQNKWIKWLCGACLDELKKCNKLLNHINAAQYWTKVEKLLHECESLRKVDFVINDTSQEYFKTVSEFDFSKTALAKAAGELIEDFAKMSDNTNTNINYNQIIKIANQLTSAGCSTQSNEMKQICNKLKQHVNDLKIKTESISLNIENTDDLIMIQNTMEELNTMNELGAIMPDIKTDANECYKTLNKQVLQVLKEIKEKYDLTKYSTANSKNLKAKLKIYSKTKSRVDVNILKDVIMQCELQTLTELIKLNENKINKLKKRNAQLEQIMTRKGGKVMQDLKKFQEYHEQGGDIMMEMGKKSLIKWFEKKKIGFNSLKEIQEKIDELNEQSKKICVKEEEEKENNINTINELNRVNNEIEKCVEIENNLMLLQPDKVIEYRTDNNFLQSSIAKLEKLLGKNQDYIFTQKLPLYDAYNALNFVNTCKSIKWNRKSQIDDEKESLLTNKYVNDLNTSTKKYLQAYGDILESNLSDLIGKLNMKDVAKCDLNDTEYVDRTQDAISKLTDCLREFREISNFDHQIKMQIENEEKENKTKQLKLVPCLFTNPDIQRSVDNYIADIISMHKEDIVINFTQYRVQQPDKLPVLRYICISMSAIDRFVSGQRDKHESYYRIASQIDSALTELGNKNTAKISPLLANQSWSALTNILNALKKNADADKDGIGKTNYREAQMVLFSALNRLMGETRTKLLVDINKENDINVEKILSLKKGLENVKELGSLLYPHLYDKNERNKVKKEEKALGSLLSDRLKQLMRAALLSARKKEFKQCEKRLENISRLMDHNTQSYIDNNIDNKNDDDDDTIVYENVIMIEYNKLKERIDEELDKVLKQVVAANELFKDPTVFNPYRRPRLITLHDQLAKSQNEKFRQLWENIYEEIVDTIQNVLNEIKERNNQIKMQKEYNMEQKTKQTMTYSEQQSYFRKIDISLSLFPEKMKDFIKTIYKDTKDAAEGNKDIMKEEFTGYLDTNSWNEMASNLNEFEKNDPKFYHTSKKLVMTKISDIYKTFEENMKKQSMKEFMDNIDILDSCKSIGLSFTTFKYCNSFINNVISIQHIQTTLEQIYKQIENRFINICKDIRYSLIGQKSYKYLKDWFFIIIKVLDNKDKLPENFAQNITKASKNLYEPIQNLINKLKTNKIKGLDKDIGDIDTLIVVLNELKELNEVEFHSNVRKFIPLTGGDEKEIDKDIENIEYVTTVKETIDMITEFKETVSKEGLYKDVIHENQSKRLTYLRDLSKKCKALIKTSSICEQHLDMKQDEFKTTYIQPCTTKMQNDIKLMQKEANDAFSSKELNTASLQRANANLEAFWAVKNVFEKEINDDQLCKEIQIENAIQICQDTAIARVIRLSEKIQIQQVNEDSINEKYLKNCAECLMKLEYLNQHMRFQTTMNENVVVNREQNELHQKVEKAIKKSMTFLVEHKETKAKINVLYNYLMDVDANYGAVFTQQQPIFEASLLELMNQKFHELGIDDLIKKLKKTENEFKEQKLDMVSIDYDQIKDTFEDIKQKYEALIVKSLRDANSFEELVKNVLPTIATDARSIATNAINEKTDLLNNFYSSGVNFFKSSFSWFSDQKQSEQKVKKEDNPRDCYWTDSMRDAVPELIPYILALWTLSNASCYYENKNTLKKARNAQIIAICSILCLDIDSDENKLINNLVEVGTGEGKSLIMGITAIVLALLDFDVYCACYSDLLSKRDQNAFDDLFIQFGVQNNIKYQTFDNILEEMITDGGDVRELTTNIVLGDEKKDNDAGDQKMNQDYLGKRQKILFIDEVDKFFSTDVFGKQYTPSCTIPSKEMKNLILYIWKEYLANESKGSAITPEKIEQSDEYKALLGAFNEEWHELLQESIKDIIDGIRTFSDDSYKIENGRDISYKFGDTYSSKVFYGYRTLFTYLHELDRGNITDEDYVHEKLTWFLKCGSFSYSEIPNDFYSILGVTGTLQSLSKKEHQVIRNSYGIKKYVVMPSLFDKTGKLEYAQNRDIFLIQSEYYFNQLHATIKQYQNNAPETNKRPIVVFFENETKLKYFYNLDICKTWRLNDKIQLLTPELSDIEKENRILNTTKPNGITLATEDYARGIDFKVFDKKLEKKGMHVELTYWPRTLAEEIQTKGRTARQGQTGSFHIILNEQEICDECAVSSEDIEKHRKDGDLYEWLNKIRSKVFEKQYDEAANFVKQIKPIHEQSEKLAMSLRTRDIKSAKQQLLVFNKGANILSAAKLSILLDATGSMASCLTQCKTVIQKTIPQLVQFLKDNNIDADSFEIQVIAYRNYNVSADDVLEFCSFTSDENVLTKFIHSVKPGGGWGNEAVELAFGQLNRQAKKPNIIMLMADAPAQTKKQAIFKRKDSCPDGTAHWDNARGGIFKDNLDWDEELKKFMSENNNASIFCFHLKNSKGKWGAKSNFEEIASRDPNGKGKAIKLDIDDEALSIALLQSALSESILLKINNGNMDYVNKFRAQHKNMPTFL